MRIPSVRKGRGGKAAGGGGVRMKAARSKDGGEKNGGAHSREGAQTLAESEIQRQPASSERGINLGVGGGERGDGAQPV